MVRGNVHPISTSTIEPSSFLVTDGVGADDTEMSIHGKRTVLERLVMGGERGLRRKHPVLSGGDPNGNCAKPQPLFCAARIRTARQSPKAGCIPPWGSAGGCSLLLATL